MLLFYQKQPTFSVPSRYYREYYALKLKDGTRREPCNTESTRKLIEEKLIGELAALKAELLNIPDSYTASNKLHEHNTNSNSKRPSSQFMTMGITKTGEEETKYLRIRPQRESLALKKSLNLKDTDRFDLIHTLLEKLKAWKTSETLPLASRNNETPIVNRDSQKLGTYWKKEHIEAFVKEAVQEELANAFKGGGVNGSTHRNAV